MSRKFERMIVIKKEAEQIAQSYIQSKEFWNKVIKPKPKWIPQFLWKMIIKSIFY